MHTVDLLEESIRVAQRLGYQIRQEWLGGAGGGACEFGGRRWIFVDLALNAIEQLEQVTDALRDDPGVHSISVSPAMSRLLHRQRAA
ncbi:MAG: hypothetical protein R3C99_11865 [Pirellulaceae bacterium]|nr:hypothetical protein [Planctomycetales bacterium]MCA9208767.1 hypothetical protein [Planctomycetales bacterium]MCA9219660.1 hypothetical protein [Planctomycetales bacterium]